MKNITIIGAGNVGSAMAIMLAQNTSVKLKIFSKRKNLWKDKLGYRKINSAESIRFISGYEVTDSIEKAVTDADRIYITLPSFLRENIIHEISKHVRPGAMIVFVPGCGGVEFFCKPLMEKKCIIVGFDRVPAVSRLKEYGSIVEFQWKKNLKAAGLNIGHKDMEKVCEELTKELGIKFSAVKSYISITLTPANPIMHPVRLYSMFKDKRRDSVIDHKIMFYGEWDNATSQCLFECDDELQQICKAIGVNEITFLREHYESYTPQAMTDKMHSIPSFRMVESPLKYNENGEYIIDFDSRYFTEDFTFGLFIIKGMAKICKIDTPMIDRIIEWYLNITDNVEYRDIPAESGLKSIEDIRNLYML
ncbi:MAG: NAD/NADP octopine/nopaline dehydrogenase family protein [Lachnospiraceae bacterium]|nr:NAD/NADP octopine/nopaline dehydrogenase family protein [Lachnospiraceae bacterium]